MRQLGPQCLSLTGLDGGRLETKADVGADENADNTFEDRREDTPIDEKSDDDGNGSVDCSD